MAEKLEWCIGLQPSLDIIVGQGRNPKGQLRLGNAGLNDHRFDQYVIGRTGREFDIVEAHIAECVEPPGFHRYFSPV